MGLTFKRKDSLEKMFEEFAIEPKEDKKDKPETEKTTINFSVNQQTESNKKNPQ